MTQVTVYSSNHYENNTFRYMVANDETTGLKCFLERKGYKTGRYVPELRGIENTKNGYLSKNILHAEPFQAQDVHEAKEKFLELLDKHIASLTAIREAINNHHFE